MEKMRAGKPKSLANSHFTWALREDSIHGNWGLLGEQGKRAVEEVFEDMRATEVHM